jgi:hypothetical protein
MEAAHHEAARFSAVHAEKTEGIAVVRRRDGIEPGDFSAVRIFHEARSFQS